MLIKLPSLNSALIYSKFIEDSHHSPKCNWRISLEHEVTEAVGWCFPCACTVDRTYLWSRLGRKSQGSFSPLATQHKLTQKVDHKSTVYAWNLLLFVTCVNLWADLWICLASHHKSVCKLANLHWLASTCESVWPELISRIRISNLRSKGFGEVNLPKEYKESL